MRKVLIVSIHDVFSYNGSSVAQKNLTAILSKNGFQIEHFHVAKSSFQSLLYKLPKYGKYLRQIFLLNELYRLLKCTKQQDFDSVLGIYPDSYVLKLMYLFRLVDCEIDMSLWYHNSYSMNRRYSILYRVFERELLCRMNRIYFISEGLKKKYEEEFPEINSSYILNHVMTFPRTDVINNRKNDSIVLGVSGNLDDSCLVAFEELLVHVSRFNNLVINYIGRRGKMLEYYKGIYPEILEVKEPGNNSNFLELMEGVDLHMVLLSDRGKFSSVEYETIFPTRLIEVVASSRPFITITGKNSFLGKEISTLTNQRVLFDVRSLTTDLILEACGADVDCSALVDKYSDRNILNNWRDSL